MKTVISLLIISASTVSFAQNQTTNLVIPQQNLHSNNVAIQQRFNFNNSISLDNNVGTFNNARQVSNPNINIPKPNVYIPNVINRRNKSHGPNGTSNPIVIENNILDNVGENEVGQVIIMEKVKHEKEAPQVSLNLNIDVNLPSINLNRVKEEKRTPKRLNDFRITTGNGSSSSGSSHTRKKSKKTSYKKVIKSIKYCWRKNFKQNIKFQSSNDCFLF